MRTKRVDVPPGADDGRCLPIDRWWPRGASHRVARIDAWWRDLAPSTRPRTWFVHAPSRFREFRARYQAKLASETAALEGLAREARRGRVTPAFAARDAERSNAAVLRELLEEVGRRRDGADSLRRTRLRPGGGRGGRAVGRSSQVPNPG